MALELARFFLPGCLNLAQDLRTEVSIGYQVVDETDIGTDKALDQLGGGRGGGKGEFENKALAGGEFLKPKSIH